MLEGTKTPRIIPPIPSIYFHISTLKVFERIFAAHPQLLAVLVQEKRYRNERDRQEAQQRTRPGDAKLSIHGGREKRERGTEARAHEIVAGEHARGVVGVRVSQVVQDRVEEQEGADGEPRGADDGHDPVHGFAGRPAEPEQADWYAEGADEGWREAFFGLEFAFGVELGFDVFVHVPEERGEDDERADQNAEE